MKVSGYAYDWFDYPPSWDDLSRGKKTVVSDHLCINPDDCPNKN